MKRNTVRLTESQLHRVIKESVKKVLKESSPYDNGGNELFDKIDSYLGQFGDAYVSRFYSDDYQITLAVSKEINRREIKEYMQQLGYGYYTSGGNGNYVMMTFKPINQ